MSPFFIRRHSSLPFLFMFLLCLINNCFPAYALRVVVVGGGAAGYFSAIHCARELQREMKPFEVVLLEAARSPLSKVLISGGGRCNVMHDPRKGPQIISKGYPRGQRELLGPLTTSFTPDDTFNWFQREGVSLKIEQDGRCFPTTDRSESIIEALEKAAKKAGVQVKCGYKVSSIQKRTQPQDGGFLVEYQEVLGRDNDVDDVSNEQSHDDDSKIPSKSSSSSSIVCDSVIVATGGSRAGHSMVAALGHTIVSPIPSLFSFKINDKALTDLAGVSVRESVVK